MISITEVDTSPDLRTAKVYFSVYGDAEQVEEARKHLQKASRFLSHQLIGRLDLRHTPQLEFVFDSSMESADRILRLMRQIESERPTDDHADQQDG